MDTCARVSFPDSTMIKIQPKWRYIFLFLLIQLLVTALLSCKEHKEWLKNAFNIFCQGDGEDVYANLPHVPRDHTGGPVLSYCPVMSPLIVGPIRVRFFSPPSLDYVQRKNPLVVKGGYYKPPDCEARHRTAVIIPFRGREHHLKFLLYYLHPFLQRQQLNYGIYVIHQAGNYTFNRAKLMNVGFSEAMKDKEWDCLFFHDVDLVPLDDRNLYACDSNPKHAAIAMDKFGYNLPYDTYFGGVSAMTPLHYLKINGFPNNYWGWGGEDDDIGLRVTLAGMSLSRPSLRIGRYKMIKHRKDKGNEDNPERLKLLSKTNETWKYDGMNTAQYQIISRTYLPLYTNITVNIGTAGGLY
ncbi:beta-1,4-galactosyltransferase 3-like [Solea solea]|uniref:beta-1,4-galactosyltransferase 3-like n=1 Tax=Solea solea TaxID=90069 RepID=UPI00272A4004|nr:beta-1,4-galactosyltransferase 3-like [Solea solea]